MTALPLLFTIVERTHADALTLNRRPRDAMAVVRQVVVDQTVLDAGETHRIRMAIGTLANALTHRGHLDEAIALLERAVRMHERLTGGANTEGVLAWTALAKTALCAAMTSRHWPTWRAR